MTWLRDRFAGFHWLRPVSGKAPAERHESKGKLEREMSEGTAELTVLEQQLKSEVLERQRAEETLRKDLALRDRIAKIFLTASDEDMYTEVLNLILEATNSVYGVFGFVDEDGSYVVPSMTRHIWDKCQVPDKRFVFPRDTWGDSIWPRAIRQKKTLYSNELSNLAPKGHVPIRRNITVPILHRETVVGLFQVANKATDYNDWDLAMCETLAGHIAPVLDARLQRDRHEKARRRAEQAERQLQHAQRELTIRNTIAQIFLTVSDDEMYREVLQFILEFTSSRYGTFGYINEDGAMVVPSLTTDVWDECQVPDKDVVFPRDTWGDSIWGRAIRQKETLYSNEHSHVPEGHITITRNVAVPIVHDEEVVGLIQLANRDMDYGEEDVELLGAVAQYMAPVLGARLRRDRHENGRRQAEEELASYRGHLEDLVEDRTAGLEDANRELEAFAYSVSHDLRGPLRAIDGFSRILLEECAERLDTEGTRLLGVVRENTTRMATLIDDLLELSRISRRPLATTRIDMDAVVRAVVREVKQQHADRETRFVLGSLAPASCDSRLIRQVLVNLLANAVKFASPHRSPVIEVCCAVEENENVYSVKDNGVGFDMEYAGKLFGLFQRLHRPEEFEGTGVGLAIVERIIRRHGGRVWGEGGVDEGATFCFTLPNEGG